MPIVRARDVQQNIRAMGFEKGVVHTLELLLEEFAGHRQIIRDMAEIQEKTTDQLVEFLRLGDGLRRKVEEMQRVNEQSNDME